MTAVVVRHAAPRLLAAILKTVTLGAIGATWGPALDRVWAFLQVASAVHRGSYATLKRTPDAIHEWRHAAGRTFAGHSWEIDGDPQPHPEARETAVENLLR